MLCFVFTSSGSDGKKKKRRKKKETFHSFGLRFRRAFAYEKLFSQWHKNCYASASVSIVYVARENQALHTIIYTLALTLYIAFWAN